VPGFSVQIFSTAVFTIKVAMYTTAFNAQRFNAKRILNYWCYSREDGCRLSVVAGRPLGAWAGGAAGCSSSSGMPFTTQHSINNCIPLT